MGREQIKVEYIDHMGSDLSTVNSARVSFDKESEFQEEWDYDGNCPPEGFTEDDHYDSDLERGMSGYRKLKDGDVKLIKYLAKHKHWTPAAHTSISLRVSAPVPIRTQCFKHKIGMVENEESRRYIKSTPEIFIPEFRMKPEGSIKQGSAGLHPDNKEWKTVYEHHVKEAVTIYEEMVANGVAPEQARFALPQGAIVKWIWTGNLVSFANFYNKRIDPYAQEEVQEVARQVSDIIEPLFPVSWKALTD